MGELLVASEYTEPSFHIQRVLEGLNKTRNVGHNNSYGLLLITKNISGSIPIWKRAQELNIPTVTHVTITGLGGSILEPLVPNWREAIKALSTFAAIVKDKNTQASSWESKSHVVLRVDPLIPHITNFQHIRELVKAAHEVGITRVRTSVIDFYPFVRDKFEANNLRHPTTFQPPFKYDLLMELAKICTGFSMTLESCAEDVDIAGLEKVGCADREEWRKLGLNLFRGYPKRQECFCNVTKHDLLSHEPYCGYNCLYCYWGKFRK